MCRRALAVLAVLALGGMAPASGAPDPGLRYAVSGAGPLALRAGPDPGSEVAGSLPAGSRDLALTGRSVEASGGVL